MTKFETSIIELYKRLCVEYYNQKDKNDLNPNNYMNVHLGATKDILNKLQFVINKELDYLNELKLLNEKYKKD